MTLRSMFDRLFRRRRKASPAPLARAVPALVRGLEQPAVHLVSSRMAARSHLGGTPQVITPFAWPKIGDRPLDFLAQIDLRDLAECHRFEWLPDSGALLFFYDIAEQPWGFDPKDAGAWSVIHVPDAIRDPLPLTGTSAPATAGLHRVDIAFIRIETFPDVDALEIFDFTDEELDIYEDHRSSPFADRPAHQIGGFAVSIQGPMELECELVSNGLYVDDPAACAGPLAEVFAARAREWRLLLQVDSDEAAKAMWGDLGRLYFWIREDDARARRFDRAWVVLQCH